MSQSFTPLHPLPSPYHHLQKTTHTNQQKYTNTRFLLAALTGLTAAGLHITGFLGFAFYILAHLVTWAGWWRNKKKWNDGIMEHMGSFVLFWT